MKGKRIKKEREKGEKEIKNWEKGWGKGGRKKKGGKCKVENNEGINKQCGGEEKKQGNKEKRRKVEWVKQRKEGRQTIWVWRKKRKEKKGNDEK